MPLFGYFAVVGSFLLGLLYVAEAQLGPPPTLSISTNFHGLPAPWKAATSTRILTVRDGPAPDMSYAAVAQSKVETVPSLPKAPNVTERKSKKKARKTARSGVNRNLYAHSTVAPRQTSGLVW